MLPLAACYAAPDVTDIAGAMRTITQPTPDPNRYRIPVDASLVSRTESCHARVGTGLRDRAQRFANLETGRRYGLAGLNAVGGVTALLGGQSDSRGTVLLGSLVTLSTTATGTVWEVLDDRASQVRSEFDRGRILLDEFDRILFQLGVCMGDGDLGVRIEQVEACHVLLGGTLQEPASVITDAAIAARAGELPSTDELEAQDRTLQQQIRQQRQCLLTSLDELQQAGEELVAVEAEATALVPDNAPLVEARERLSAAYEALAAAEAGRQETEAEVQAAQAVVDGLMQEIAALSDESPDQAAALRTRVEAARQQLELIQARAAELAESAAQALALQEAARADVQQHEQVDGQARTALRALQGRREALTRQQEQTRLRQQGCEARLRLLEQEQAEVRNQLLDARWRSVSEQRSIRDAIVWATWGRLRNLLDECALLDTGNGLNGAGYGTP
jgi:hypothetical protein